MKHIEYLSINMLEMAKLQKVKMVVSWRDNIKATRVEQLRSFKK